MPSIIPRELVASAARIASGQSAEFLNNDHKGIQLNINRSAVSGTTPTLVVKLQGKDPVSGTWYDILATGTINNTGHQTLTIFPGAPATANVSGNAFLPAMYRIDWTIGGTTPSFTFSVGASLME